MTPKAKKKEDSKPTQTSQASRGRRRERTGVVVSDKMNKTIVVETTRLVPHPLYGRVMRKKSKAKAHDEENKAKTGDTVKILETRPLSKTKRWTFS